MFANIEYEVDELRRDINLCEIANEAGKVSCTFIHDRCIVSPGDVRTKNGRGYTVCIHPTAETIVRHLPFVRFTRLSFARGSCCLIRLPRNI